LRNLYAAPTFLCGIFTGNSAKLSRSTLERMRGKSAAAQCEPELPPPVPTATALFRDRHKRSIAEIAAVRGHGCAEIATKHSRKMGS
jgi:hypothetical protein